MQSWIKKYFMAGALVLVPLAVTIWVFKTIALWSEGFVETFLPIRLKEITLFGYEIPGLGLFLTFLLILLVGVLTRLYLGRKLLEIGDRLMQKIPLGRGIYSSIKQLLQGFLLGDGRNFQQVVLVEFPKEGSHMIGFVMGESQAIARLKKKPMINIFIPTTPNPTSGFLLITSPDKVTPLDILPEQAFKFIVSGGTLHS